MKENEPIYNKVRSIIREDGQSRSYIGEDDFVSLVKDGIIINFHVKQQNLDIENIFRTVKRTQSIINEHLDCVLEKIEIDIYAAMPEMRQDGRTRSKYASWIAGIFDGKIRIIAERDDDEAAELYIILTHEIVHLAVYEMSRGHCPYWLDEGIAVFLSQELPYEYFSRLDSASKKDAYLPLDILARPLPVDTDEKLRQLAYAQCFSITEYLVATYGWNKIKSIVNQSAKRPVMTILADMSLNYYLLEQAWKRWVRRKSHKK
jgi:hypothetical protein